MLLLRDGSKPQLSRTLKRAMCGGAALLDVELANLKLSSKKRRELQRGTVAED